MFKVGLGLNQKNKTKDVFYFQTNLERLAPNTKLKTSKKWN
jgi:hypothetical protein